MSGQADRTPQYVEPAAGSSLYRVREAVMDGLANASSDSAAIKLDTGDLGIVFLESAEVFLVTIKQANLVVMGDST